MNTLFVVAEMQEAHHLIDYYKLRSIKHYKRGNNDLCSIKSWMNGNIQLIVTGPGVSNVISTLSKTMYFGFLSYDTNIINVGYAGAKGFDVGEVVCVKACHYLEFPTKANVEIENCISLSDDGYDCYTSFDFVEKADNITDKALFDMELAYIAKFIYKSLYSIKIVSDNLSYDGFKDFDGNKAWKEAIKKIEERRK